MLEAGDQLRPATEAVAIEGDVFPVHCVVWRSAGDLAPCMTGDGATARIAHAGHGYSLYFEVGSAGAEHLAAVRRAVAQPDDVFHDEYLRLNNMW